MSKKRTAGKGQPDKKVAEIQKGAAAKASAAKGGKTVEELIADYPDDLRALATRLRQLVHETVPGVTEAVKWGTPVFERNGGLCYLQVQKGYLRFGFYSHWTHFEDADGLLEGTGTTMRHVKVRTESDIRPVLSTWLRQAAELNEG